MGRVPPHSTVRVPPDRWIEASSPISPPLRFHRKADTPSGSLPTGEWSTCSQPPSNHWRQPSWWGHQVSALPPRRSVAQRTAEDKARLLPFGALPIPLQQGLL